MNITDYHGPIMFVFMLMMLMMLVMNILMLNMMTVNILMMTMLMVMNMMMVRTRGMTLEKEPTSGPASRVASRQANFSD